ncbi:MAG: hypothetical protein UT61_C0053G0028, partial [Candidatus Woesebacteria bacterium GW2011_GWA1_39_8]
KELAQIDKSAVDAVQLYPSYPDPNTTPSFLGQNHAYSVVFRGNGEAVVSLKVTLTNKGSDDLKEINLRLPNINPTDISVYQMLRTSSCSRYKYQEYDAASKTYIQLNPPVCEQYQPIDYYSGYGSYKYQKADSDFTGDTLTIALPVPITANSSGSYFVYFRAFGFAKKNVFGAYDFDFESLKTEDEIANLSVGISTDSDFVLKNAQGSVNYRVEAPNFAAVGGTVALGVPAASTQMDSYVAQIGRGTISKSASNLSVLESYSVSGSYAKSRLQLYAKQLITIALIIVVVAVLIIALLKVMLRKFSKKKINADEGVDTKDQEQAMPSKTRNLLVSLGLSFASSLFMAIYTGLLIFASTNLSRLLGYQYEMFFVLFIVVISFCVYSVLLFGPALYVGAKRGVGWGMATILMTIFWLVIYLGVGLLVVYLLNPIRPIPTPYPVY